MNGYCYLVNCASFTSFGLKLQVTFIWNTRLLRYLTFVVDFFTSPIGGTQSWIVYNDLAKQNRVFILNFMIRKAMSIEWRLMISSKRCWNCTQGGDCCRLKVWWFYKVCICVSRMVLLFRDLVLYWNYIRPLNPCFCWRIV